MDSYGMRFCDFCDACKAPFFEKRIAVRILGMNGRNGHDIFQIDPFDRPFIFPRNSILSLCKNREAEPFSV